MNKDTLKDILVVAEIANSLLKLKSFPVIKDKILSLIIDEGYYLIRISITCILYSNYSIVNRLLADLAVRKSIIDYYSSEEY